jgi:hypothetical protein
MIEREKQMVEEARRKEIEELKRFKESLNLPIPTIPKLDQKRTATEPSVPPKNQTEASPKISIGKDQPIYVN